MELALFFYLAGVVNQVQVMSAICFAFMALGLGAAVIITTVEREWDSWPKGLLRNLLITLGILGGVTMFTPDKETMYTMAAAYGVQSVAENPNVQRVAGKSLQVLEGKLDEFIKEKAKDGN